VPIIKQQTITIIPIYPQNGETLLSTSPIAKTRTCTKWRYRRSTFELLRRLPLLCGTRLQKICVRYSSFNVHFIIPEIPL